jgi:DNA modification methylase
MHIQTVPISQIQRARYNPRKTLKPGDPAYDQLRKAVETFGLVEPLVWNQRSGNLVGGHQRLSVLEERGDVEVEVSVVDLAPRDEKALNLALNKHVGEWDFGALADMLTELHASDFDMEVAGFSEKELKELMAWRGPNAGLTDEDAVPDAPKVPVSKPGDLIRLGPHRLLCGDSTDKATVDRLLAESPAPPIVMVTDPPYGVDYNPGWRNEAARAGKIAFAARREGKVQNDQRIDWADAYTLFPGDVAYCWHASLFGSPVQQSLERSGFELRSQIIWPKTRFAISRGHYHWQHECCFYAVKKGSTGHWSGGRRQTTLWQIDALPGDSAKNSHGTQKPVECMRRPILNHTRAGDVVYDPFLGSGTSIIAAETTGRICIGLEIDPAYCDVIVDRWEQFTGNQAVRHVR